MLRIGPFHHRHHSITPPVAVLRAHHPLGPPPLFVPRTLARLHPAVESLRTLSPQLPKRP
eukprot:2954372-Prymnesium_polylepis.1